MAALRHRCGWLYFLECSSAAAMAWPWLKLSRWLRGAADVSDRCAIARLRSSTAVQLAWPNLAWLASVLPVASSTRHNNLCARSPIPREAGKTGGCFFAAPASLAQWPFSSQQLFVRSFFRWRNAAPTNEATVAFSPRRQTRLAKALRRAAPQTQKLLLHLPPWLSPRGASRASPAPRPEETKRLPRQHAASPPNRRKKNRSRRRAGAASPTRTASSPICTASRTGDWWMR